MQRLHVTGQALQTQEHAGGLSAAAKQWLSKPAARRGWSQDGRWDGHRMAGVGLDGMAGGRKGRAADVRVARQRCDL